MFNSIPVKRRMNLVGLADNPVSHLEARFRDQFRKPGSLPGYGFPGMTAQDLAVCESEDGVYPVAPKEQPAGLELASPEAIAAADSVLDEMNDYEMKKRLRSATTRRDLAYAAMNIPQDRYSAGSTAATVTTYILLKHGLQAALDFQKDLVHHED